MKSTILNIQSNGIQKFEAIVGHIKKILIHCKNPRHSISLKFVTMEGETIYSYSLDQETTVLYPWNFIDVQGRGCEYYSNGDLFVEVEGLQDGEQIEQVSLFYQ